MCRDRKDAFHRGRRYYWLKLSHVSRYWRNIICSTPPLFCYIHHRDFGRSDVDLMRNFLHFSSNMALHLDTCLGPNVGPGSRRTELSTVLSDHAHRVETMESTSYLIVELYHGMNNLKSMLVRNGLFLNRSLPSSLTRLTVYEAFPATPGEFLNVFSGLSQLRELEIIRPNCQAHGIMIPIQRPLFNR